MNLHSNSTNLIFDTCSKEINKIHIFFEEWYNGDLKNNTKTLSYLENSLSNKFFLINPDGVILSKTTIIDLVNENYDKYNDQDNPIKIWIKDINLKSF